jgi:hypothetical protein
VHRENPTGGRNNENQHHDSPTQLVRKLSFQQSIA